MASVVMALVVPAVVLAEDKKDEKKAVPQVNCPVTGKAVDKALSVEKDGKRIYVCCKNCIAKVEKDFDTYAKKMEGDGIVLEKAQTTCPVMKGNPINKKFFVDVEGKRIYVCCPGCIDPIKKEPAKYIKILEDEGVVLPAAPAEKKADEKK
jgi:YHS domain-containing protein